MNEKAKKSDEATTPAPEDKIDVSDDALAAAEAQAPDQDGAADGEAQEADPANDADAPPFDIDGPDPRDAELAATKDKLLRALAEMENVRRRGQKEREDTAKYAVSNFARDILPVADNLRRALEAIPEEVRTSDDTVKGIVEGIELIEREIAAAFDRASIKKIEPMGDKFNHDLHEAMFEVPTADAEPGTIVQVMEVGYVLNDRLLRPARVGVAKALPEAAPDTPPQDGVDTTA